MDEFNDLFAALLSSASLLPIICGYNLTHDWLQYFSDNSIT